MLARFVSIVVEGWLIAPPPALWHLTRHFFIPALVGWYAADLARWLGWIA